MHPVKTRPKKKRTVLFFVMALGAGLPPPAQAHLLDFTAASIKPGVLVSYAGAYPPGPPGVESNLRVTGVSLMGDPGLQLSSTFTLPHQNFPPGPLVHHNSKVPSLSGSFGTAGVTEPTAGSGNPLLAAGSNFTDHKNDAWLAYFGIVHQSASGNFDSGLAANFTSAPGAFCGTRATSGNILHHLTPSSSTLVLLGGGLLGLIGLGWRRRKAG